MLHIWEFDAAGRAFDLALADAQDPLTVGSVTEERWPGAERAGRALRADNELPDAVVAWGIGS
jgi:hypothetical protein